MSRRTRIASLKILLESNNNLSPDILSSVVTADSRSAAYRIAGIFEEVTNSELPFELEEWQRTILNLPVELYFRFDRKSHLVKFVREVRKEFPDILMII